MRRWIGRWLCGVGVLHSALGIAAFRESLAGMIADGGWNAMGSDPARQLAVGFLVAGVSLLLVGVIVDAAERDGRALPPAFAWGLLALCVAGIVVGPRTGVWLVLPAAVALAVRARGRLVNIR
jgi:hypothetical protein